MTTLGLRKINRTAVQFVAVIHPSPNKTEREKWNK
jgi:hypothetical protein